MKQFIMKHCTPISGLSCTGSRKSTRVCTSGADSGSSASVASPSSSAFGAPPSPSAPAAPSSPSGCHKKNNRNEIDIRRKISIEQTKYNIGANNILQLKYVNIVNNLTTILSNTINKSAQFIPFKSKIKTCGFAVFSSSTLTPSSPSSGFT